MARDFFKPSTGLLLVDSLNFCFRYTKRNGNFAADFIREVNSFADSFDCGNIIILADRYGSIYRKNIYPEYKANRKRENQTEEEALEFKKFIDEYNRALDVAANRFKVIVIDGVEADDTIAYLSTRKAKDFSHIMILSTDKDLNQLVNHKVSRFSYITRKETNIHNFEEQNGCTPSDFILTKCLEGDTGDNIPGIAGIGKKRACTLARDYCDVELLLDAIPLEGKQIFIQNLNKGRDILELNYKLMDLTNHQDEILNQEHIQYIEEIYNG